MTEIPASSRHGYEEGEACPMHPNKDNPTAELVELDQSQEDLQAILGAFKKAFEGLRQSKN